MPAALRVFLLLAAALGAVPGCGGSPEPRGAKIPLKLHLNQGDAKTITATADLEMRMSGNGQKVNMGMKMRLEIGFKVAQVADDGTHTLEFRYDRIALKSTGAPQGVDFDSSVPDDGGLFGKILRTFIGHPMTTEITPTGDVRNTSGADQLITKLTAIAPNSSPDEFRKQLTGFENSLAQYFGFLPKEPVDIRDTWKTSIKMDSSSGAPLNWNLQCTLHDRQSGKAIIKYHGTLQDEGDVDVKTGTLTGTATVDEKTGLTETGEMDLTLAGKVDGMTIDATGKMTFQGK